MPSKSIGSSHGGRRRGDGRTRRLWQTTGSRAGRYPRRVPDEPSPRAAEAVALLDAVTDSLDGGEHRAGQRDMVRAVADAIAAKRHLVVAAGTGPGSRSPT